VYHMVVKKPISGTLCERIEQTNNKNIFREQLNKS
jgi:hypothetical protein